MAKPRAKLVKLLKPPLFVLVAVMLFHMLLTGSPTPLWHIESLEKPFAVGQVADDHLVLTSGRKLGLPLINCLPHDIPLFFASIREGVEINNDGRVFGLLWVDRGCGNDPCLWYKLKINLSELSAALKPDGIDGSMIPTEAIEFIAEHHRIGPGSWNPEHLRQAYLRDLRYIRGQFEYSLAQRGKPQHAAP